MSMANPDRLRCAWCPARRFRSGADLDAHELDHRRAAIALAEAGVTLKNSRQMAERLAATVEIEEQRARGEMLARVLP